MRCRSTTAAGSACRCARRCACCASAAGPSETRHLALALAAAARSSRTVRDRRSLRKPTAGRRSAAIRLRLPVQRRPVQPGRSGRAAPLCTRGGGLIVFLGDQVQAESYNQLLGERSATPILPARLGEPLPTATYRLIRSTIAIRSSRPFAVTQTAACLTTPIWKYITLCRRPQAQRRPGIRQRRPGHRRERIGRGRCILVATAASPAVARPHQRSADAVDGALVVAQLSAAGARDAAVCRRWPERRPQYDGRR